MIKKLQTTLAAAFLVCAGTASAGVDIAGTVTRIQVAADGTLYFGTNAPTAPNYCADHWPSLGLNMFIPATDPNYAYDYGLLMLAMSKAKSVYIGNISVFNGSTSCDISKTGYGIVLLQ